MLVKLPFKFYVLRCIAEQTAPCSYEDLLPLAQKAYPGERQVSGKTLLTHMEAFCAVGATEVADVFEENGDIVMKYRITDYGKSLLKYIKNKGEEAT